MCLEIYSSTSTEALNVEADDMSLDLSRQQFASFYITFHTTTLLCINWLDDDVTF